MKIISSIIAFMFLMHSAHAQQSAEINGLVATLNDKCLLITWNYPAASSNYWEVQGSEDGKSFKSIGLVLGAKPGSESAFVFKADHTKMRKGLRYYRLLQVQNDQTAIAFQAFVARYNPKG